MRTIHVLRVLFVGLAFAASAANAVVTLSESPTATVPGAIVTATWAGIVSPTGSDWIGLYAPGAPNNPTLSWRYTTGAGSGSVPFTLPGGLAVGTYELRLLYANGYTVLATSNTFTVGRSVSGTVTLSGSPLAGVAFAATNGGVCNVSNASGQYSCSVPNNWSGSITPSLVGYSFTPGSRSYSNVTSNQTAQTYTAALDYQVSGTVTDGASPVAGVAFAGTNGAICTSSNASGQYICYVPSGWSGSVTPSLNNYALTPASRSYTNVTSAQPAQDYTVVPLYQVSGTVSLNGIPLPNVAMGATGGVTCSPTDASGQYSCTAPAGWSGNVTPSATGYTFTPASRSYTSLPGNQAAQTYAAAVAGGADPIYFIHVDHLNTPRAIYDASQQLRWKWEQQEPFGVNVPDENPSSLGVYEFSLRFPGQYFDKEVNLHYNYFRTYDPLVGRYGQSDPIGLASGLNTYSYVRGNALSFVDPLGLFDESGVAATSAAVTGTAATISIIKSGLMACVLPVASGIVLAGWSTSAGSACDDDVQDKLSECKDDKCEKAKRRAERIYNELAVRSIPQYMYGVRHGSASTAGHHTAVTQGIQSLKNALKAVEQYCNPLPPEYPKWKRLADQDFPARHAR